MILVKYSLMLLTLFIAGSDSLHSWAKGAMQPEECGLSLDDNQIMDKVCRVCSIIQKRARPTDFLQVCRFACLRILYDDIY